MISTRDASPIAPADLAAIRALHARAEATDGHPALGETVWRDLESGGQPGSGGVFAEVDGQLVGYAHVARSDNFSPPHWAAGLVVDPAVREGPTEDHLLSGIVAHVAEQGERRIVLWIVDPTARDDERTRRGRFTHTRDLLQMRVGLPIDEEAQWPPGTTVRAFEPGRDEAAWLAVNNRAFRNHPEQGGWAEATLRRRIADAWFDPAGFLLAWDARGLAGFCWTKVQATPDGGGADETGALGEIFVIGVDPDRQGTGLGRALVVAGLASLASRGIRTGVLYVDAANTAAVSLYRALGFTEHRRDRAYEQVVA